jgi:two-component system, response regulator PdtaR
MLKPRRLQRMSGTVLQSPPVFRPRLVLAPSGGSGSDASNRDVARILIVEDDYLISGDMETELAAAGFEVVGVARSAKDAVSLAIEQRPNLIIMDIRLDGAGDGVEAAHEIFKACGIRSLFASAYSNPETRHRAEASLPLGWIAKPYTMGSLVDAVRTALRSLGDSGSKS